MKPAYRKILKIVAISFLLIVFLLKFVGEPILERKVQNWQPKKKHLYYDLQLGEVNVQLLLGSIYVKGFTLSLLPEEMNKFDSLRAGHLYEVTTDLDIKLVSAFRLLFFNELKINAVKFDNSEITWYPNFDNKIRQHTQVPDNQQPTKLHSVELGKMFIDNAKVIIKDQYGAAFTEIINIDSVNIMVDDFSIQFSEDDTVLLPEFKELIVETGSFDFIRDSSSYRYGSFLLNSFHQRENDQYLIDVGINDLTAKLSDGKGDISLKSFFLENLNFDDFLYRNKIIADSLRMQDVVGNLKIYNMEDESEKDTIDSKESIDTINIKGFLLKNGSLTMEDQFQNKTLSIDSLNLILSDIHSSIRKPDQTTFKGTLIKSGLIYTKVNNFYSISLQAIEFVTESQVLDIKKFELTPSYTPAEFSKVISYEQDLFTISMDSARILFENSFKVFDKELLLSQIDVYQLNLDVYRDKWVDDPPYQEKKIPSVLISELAFPLNIDKVNLHNTNVSYTQYGDIVQNDSPGKFELIDLNGEITNISNIQENLSVNSIMEVNIQSKVMNAGNLVANFTFDLNDHQLYFKSKGKLEELPLVRLNPFLMGVLLVEIPNGQVHNLQFEMEADKDQVFGKLDMEYNDLEVTIHKTKQPNKKSGFINFIANAVVKKKNIKGDKGYKEGTIFADVVKEKFIFNNFWQGIKSGLMDILVLTSNNKKALGKYEKEQMKSE